MMTTTAQPASVAELEDTGTWTKSKLTANGPPPYIHESGAAPAPEKEVLTTNQVVQRFSPPDSKASTSASIEQTQTEKTQTPEAVDSKEVVPLTDANIVTSPTISSLNSSSRLTTVKQPSRSYREHSFWHTAPWRPTHNIITDPEGSARFFIEVSEFTRGKQDVSIHDVTSNPHAASKGDRITVEEGKGSPVVGFAQFPHGTNDLIRLALGDSNQMSTVKWVDMKRSGEDDWALAVPTKAAEPKIFHFRSTKTSLSRSADDLASVATQTSDSSSAPPVVGNYKFTDNDLQSTLALYSENKLSKTWKKRGKLRMYDREGVQSELSVEELEVLIVLCCAATNEKKRRKTWKKWAFMGAG